MGLAKTTAVILLLTCHVSQPAAGVRGGELPGEPSEVSRAVRKLNGLVRDLDAEATRCCGKGNPCATCATASTTIFCPCGTNMSDELVTTRNSDGSMTTTKNTGACAATCFNGLMLCIPGWCCLAIKGCDYSRVQAVQAASQRAKQTVLEAAARIERVVRASVVENDLMDTKISAKTLLTRAKRSTTELQALISTYATNHGGWRPRGGAKAKATVLSNILLEE